VCLCARLSFDIIMCFGFLINWGNEARFESECFSFLVFLFNSCIIQLVEVSCVGGLLFMAFAFSFWFSFLHVADRNLVTVYCGLRCI
jgi:hypothetical protein